MTTDPWITAARDRHPVLLADGRTARLIYWPTTPSPEHRRRSRGTKALVELRPGVLLSIPTSDITIQQ